MLKALLMASVIIGAFLFQPFAYSQESGSNPCPFGGDLLDGMCTMAAPKKPSYTLTVRSGSPQAGVTFSGQSKSDAISALAVYVESLQQSNPSFQPRTAPYPGYQCEYTYSYSYTNSPSQNHGQLISYILETRTGTPTTPTGYCPGSVPDRVDAPVSSNNNLLDWIDSESYQCPPDGSVGAAFTQGPFVTESGQNLCFYPAATPDNDNECPPDTVGGCDEPPEEPNCFRGGANQLVCFEDPDEKCDSNLVNGEKVYTNCAEGCGFVNGNFLCSETPDLPSLDSCLVTTNGYVCPSDTPPPNDDIPNPEKPLPDMTKQDFKDTNIGVETRLDATNKLLSDMMARNAENTEAINIGQGKSNAYLKQIDLNTKRTADSLDDIKDGLTGDGLDLDDNHRGLIGGALGITGDESIDDLTKEEITLDSFRSEFQWSGGGGSCPAPRQINILGASFQMDWQPYCQAFAVASHFILAAAYFFAAFIAFGGRK